MIGKVLCTICARSGSKGVINKNIREIAGKPLLEHTIDQALESGAFDFIAFSSDSEEYQALAKTAGVSVVVSRPEELACDRSGKVDAIRHCVRSAEKALGFNSDIIVDLDCTSPLRFPSDIVGSINLLKKSNFGNVITGALARRSPYFNMVERKSDGSIDLVKRPEELLLSRQQAPICYDMNASIYVWRREALMEKEGLFSLDTGFFEMPEERSIDIDSELDFDIVSMLLDSRSKCK